MKIAVIFNPHARKNRASGKRLRQLEKALSDRSTLYPTQKVEEIAPALHQIAERGQKYVLVDGGDGAAHWVINEAIRLWGIEEVEKRFVFVNSRGGTIDFLALVVGTTGNSRTILRTLQTQLERGEEPEIVRTPVVRVRGKGAMPEENKPFERYAWATALAGYSANFYGPWYRSTRMGGTLRILALLGEALETAAGRQVFQGPLAKLKPKRIERHEYDYFRPLLGTVHIDGQPFRDANGELLRRFTLLDAGSVPVNLGGIVRVFHQALPPHIHVHVGELSPTGTIAAIAQSGLGKDFTRGGFYDGPARSLRLESEEGPTLIPCLDGELFPGLQSLELEHGGFVRFARVLG